MDWPMHNAAQYSIARSVGPSLDENGAFLLNLDILLVRNGKLRSKKNDKILIPFQKGSKTVFSGGGKMIEPRSYLSLNPVQN